MLLCLRSLICPWLLFFCRSYAGLRLTLFHSILPGHRHVNDPPPPCGIRYDVAPLKFAIDVLIPGLAHHWRMNLGRCARKFALRWLVPIDVAKSADYGSSAEFLRGGNNSLYGIPFQSPMPPESRPTNDSRTTDSRPLQTIATLIEVSSFFLYEGALSST